jgi:undecaprenyl-diphosphatase
VPDWLVVVILGIIEGITEFLPISSTGHLLLAENWLPRQSDLFNIVIQSAAVVAVLPLFRVRIGQLVFRWREAQTRDYFGKVLVAFIITGCGGLLLKELGFELPETILPVALALLIGGICFIAVERWLRGKPLSDRVTWSIAVAVGIGQLIAAIFPGASRSGTTIVLALLLGLNRPSATEFSFLVSIPTMLAAGGLEIVNELQRTTGEAENWTLLVIASVVSALVSFAAVKWLLGFVQTHTFVGFGWYRIILGGALLLPLVLK